MKRILIITILSIMLSGCHNLLGTADWQTEFLRSYVMYYNDIEGIDVRINSYPPEYDMSVFIVIGKPLGNYEDIGEQKRIYDALCEKHGDMTFNREISFLANVPYPVTCYPGADFVSIEVTSSSDYDINYPAGTLLNDLISTHFYSSKPYIDSGYIEYDCGNEDYMVRLTEIHKRLCEISADDLVLAGTGNFESVQHVVSMPLINFNFDSEPTLSKTHTFTVTMTADDGRVFSDTIEMTFD